MTVQRQIFMCTRFISRNFSKIMPRFCYAYTVLGITGSYEGYYSGNGTIYNRGSWGSGYNIGWFSAYTSDSGSSFTQSSTSIKFNAASAAASNFGAFLFGNSNKT